MSSNVQLEHFTMSPVFPFDIIAEIIDIVGDDKDTNLLKELALVSHSFHQICIKHLFATIDLHDDFPIYPASSKKGFIKLLTSRPDVVKYIRKLTYVMGFKSYDPQSFSPDDNTDHLLSPVLPNLLRTIPCLNCLTINALKLDWNILDSSLTSAFLHLMPDISVSSSHASSNHYSHRPLICPKFPAV